MMQIMVCRKRTGYKSPDSGGYSGRERYGLCAERARRIAEKAIRDRGWAEALSRRLSRFRV